MYRFGFVIEQALGHITHGQNLRRFVEEDPDVKAAWFLPVWQRSGLSSQMPIYRHNWTIQAGWQTRRMLAALPRLGQPQALFFHTQITAVLAQDWLSRIPSIVSLDATPRQYDVMGDIYQHETGPGWLEKLKWRVHERCFRLARHLVTWSAWTKQGLIDDYECAPEKITVIPPGVDIDLWAPTEQSRLTGKPVQILFVGGDFERKGGQVLFEAFRRLRQTIAAVGPTLDQTAPIELHVVTRDVVPPEPGLVVHNGLEPNSSTLRQLYRDCDIFCLPTLADTLGLVLLEAGAAGLPLVATDLAAIPEIVVSGQTGLLVPPGDAEALAGALAQLVADQPLRLALGAGARETVQQRFNARTNTLRLLELLKQVADQGSSGAAL